MADGESPSKRVKRSRPTIELMYHQPSKTDGELISTINDSYLSEKSDRITLIRKDLDRQFYTNLPQFFKEEIFQEFSIELMSENITWKKVGPTEHRNYEVAVELTFPCTLSKIHRMFKSMEFLKLLKNYSELDLINPSAIVFELQRWSKGCYNGIHEPEEGEKKYKTIIHEDENVNQMKSTSEGTTDSISKIIWESMLESAKESTPKSKKESTPESTKESTPEITSEKDGSDESCRIHRRHWENNLRVLEGVGKPSTRSRFSSSSEESEKKPKFFERSPYFVSEGLRIALTYDSDDPNRTSLSPTPPKSVSKCTLDVIMQFNTNHASDNNIINYVDSEGKNAAIIHLSKEDNNLILVRKGSDISRIQRIVNDDYTGYFYNLICAYCE